MEEQAALQVHMWKPSGMGMGVGGVQILNTTTRTEDRVISIVGTAF